MKLNEFAQENSNEDLDAILCDLCNMVVSGQEKNPDKYGWVAAAIIGPEGNIVKSTSTTDGDKWRHAERNAVDQYIKHYGDIHSDYTCVTTCSPCSQSMDDRYGESCADLLKEIGISKIYSGYKDPTQGGNYPVTDNKKLNQLCEKFAEQFLDPVKSDNSPDNTKIHENSQAHDVFQSMGQQLISAGEQADKIKDHSPEAIKKGIERKLAEINDPRLQTATDRLLSKIVKFNKENPKTMAAAFGFTFAIIARTALGVGHHYGLSPTQSALILEATLPTLGNFLGYIVNGFSVKDSVQSGLIAGVIGVAGVGAASAMGEGRVIDKNALVDVYYNILMGMKPKKRIIAKGVPQSTVDLIIRGLQKKYHIDPERIEWRPSSQSEYSKISEAKLFEDTNKFVYKFLPWLQKELKIKELPKIKLLDQPETKSFGVYGSGELHVVTGGRHPVDVLRTLAHELTHWKQDTEGRLKPDSGETGSEEENEANANAGVIMRKFAEENPEHFGLTEAATLRKAMGLKAGETISMNNILAVQGRITRLKKSRLKSQRDQGIRLERQLHTFRNTHKKKNYAVGKEK